MDMFKRTRLLYDHDGDDDRISDLPDCVLLEILSRLPTPKHAIRTSCLSKRWRPLWTFLPTLVFISKHPTPDPHFFSFLDQTLTDHLSTSHSHSHKPDDHQLAGLDTESRRNFSSFLDQTLSSSHYNKLDKFQLHSRYEPKFHSLVHQWIRYAINCNVQHLDLSLKEHGFRCFPIVLDDLLLNNSIFTHLKLAGPFFDPTKRMLVSWKNLKSLYISHQWLDEDTIQNILSGSPVLETFALDNCTGFKQLHITSNSVKEFVISGMETNLSGACDTWDSCDYAPLKAPNILSLKIQGSVLLWEIELEDLSSLVEAHLDYTAGVIYYDSGCDRQWYEGMLEKNIDKLRHVKELKLGGACSKTLSHLEAEGFIAPSNIIHVVDDGTEGHVVD